MFDGTSGDRAGVPDVVVLVTDGKPTVYSSDNNSTAYDAYPNYPDAHRMALDEAIRVRNRNIRIFGVAVGDYVSGFAQHTLT